VSEKKYLSMGLSECAAYDHARGLRNKLTGWGKICKARHDLKVSRKARRLQRKAQQEQEAA
jgi:hypothetical protein